MNDPGNHPVDLPVSRTRTTIVLDPASLRRSMGTILVSLAAFLMVVWVFDVTRHFLFLLLLAWLFAIAMEPGIDRLMKRGMRRGSASAVVGSLAILAFVLLAVLFGDLFFQQLVQLVKGVPDLVSSAITWVNHTFHLHLDQNSLQKKLNLTAGALTSTATNLAGGVLGVVSSLSAIVFDLVTVLVFGFYFAADGPRLQRYLAQGMPPKAQRVFLKVWEITVRKTGGYVASKVILAAMSAGFHGVFFWAIKVPYWLPFAIFVGVTAQFIPMIGTYIGIVLPVLFTVFNNPWQAVAIIVFALIYQNVETYVFTPRVSRRTMEVNPAIALASVFVGAAIWGPIGAIIGIPLAAAAVTVLETYSHRYELVPELAMTENNLEMNEDGAVAGGTVDGLDGASGAAVAPV
jgi:predicted PurR-regulated permease PerM